MQIVAISDTHGKHDQVDIPDCDVLVHAGDFTMAGTLGEVSKFADWMCALPAAYKIVIAGNHDFAMAGVVGKELLRERGITYLQDEATSIEGLQFYGSPWVPQFGQWAFMKARDELATVWARIPSDTDVLVTHGGPHGLMDEAPREGGGSEKVGCAYLLEHVRRVRPRLHIFGHIHEGYGMVADDDRLSCNAAICDGAYRPVNAPWSIELDSKLWHVNLVATG